MIVLVPFWTLSSYAGKKSADQDSDSSICNEEEDKSSSCEVSSQTRGSSEPKSCDELSLDGSDAEIDCLGVKQHPSYEQVILDVNRCAGRLEHIRRCYFHRTDNDEASSDLSETFDRRESNQETVTNNDSSNSTYDEHCGDSKEKQTIVRDLQYQKILKKKLAVLIIKLLIKKPHLHYYQGFHDVCLTYMTLHGFSGAINKLDQMIDSHFSAFMQPTMYETQEFLALIPIIIGLKDIKIQEFLEKAELGTIFALSWVITWFSHVLPDEQDVESIFLHLEKTNDPHLILYLCAEIVLFKKYELLELEPEMSTVHHFLCQVPRKEKLPIDRLLKNATEAFLTWPPDTVKKKLSRHRASLQVHNYNVIRNFMPTLASLITSGNSRRAIIVFVIASAFALQFDRWIR